MYIHYIFQWHYSCVAVQYGLALKFLDYYTLKLGDLPSKVATLVTLLLDINIIAKVFRRSGDAMVHIFTYVSVWSHMLPVRRWKISCTFCTCFPYFTNIYIISCVNFKIKYIYIYNTLAHKWCNRSRDSLISVLNDI